MYLAGSFGNQLDKIVVMPLLGSAVLGNYTLALQVVTVFTMFTTILFKFLLPQESSGIKNKFLIQIVIIISIIVSLAGIFLSPLVIPNFFPKYIDVGVAIQIMSLSIIPITISTICTSRLLSKEKSKISSYRKYFVSNHHSIRNSHFRLNVWNYGNSHFFCFSIYCKRSLFRINSKEV